MVSRTKRFFMILSFNIILIVIGIIILELVFGNWIRQNNIHKLNIIRNRTIRYKIGNLYESPVKTAIYTRDKFGLRGQFQHPGEIVILTVGGSTTDQRYITDGETWQDTLQQKFLSIGKNIAVANAGVDGQSSVGHIKNFDWWFPTIPDLKPKYILFYIGLNDFYKEEGYGYNEIVGDKEKSIRQILREKSAFYSMAKTLYGIYTVEVKHDIGHRAIEFKKYKWTRDPLHSSYDKWMKTKLTEYSERLTVLISKTKESGATPIFVTQPCRKYRFQDGILEGIQEIDSYDGTSINGVDYYYMMRKLDSVTCSVSEKHDLLCIDMAKETTWQDDDFYDFSHMTPKGAKKVAEILFERLKDKF